MSEKRGKKRSKHYYIKCANKKPKHAGNNLDIGMKGFLVTCNSHEGQAVREMYNLLNEYADKQYGPEKIRCNEKDDVGGSSESEEEDVEKAMLKEVKDLKEKNITERRFQNTNTKAKNCIFIRTTIDDPCELAHSILSDLAETKKQKTRYALRLVPVSCTCKAFEKDIKKTATDLFLQHFQTPFGTGYGYTIIIKARNNNGIGRDSLLPLLGGIVKDMNPLHQVCHDRPDRFILVEIVGPIFCISVVKDFLKFRKYNLIEVLKGSAEKLPPKPDLEGGEEKDESSTVIETENKAKVSSKIDEIMVSKEEDVCIEPAAANENGSNITASGQKSNLELKPPNSESKVNESECKQTEIDCKPTDGAGKETDSEIKTENERTEDESCKNVENNT